MGRICFDAQEAAAEAFAFAAYDGINYVDKVSCKDIFVYAGDTATKLPVDATPQQLEEAAAACGDRKRVVLMDCGVKSNILRCLISRGVTLIRVPWNYDFNGRVRYDGLFISNGPGDPNTCADAVQVIRKAMQNTQLPIFGICMGNQLLAKAGGGKVYKLKYGHRSQNQPVRLSGTNKCFITSQNHGYAVDHNSLDAADWEPLFVNMNDGSNEGIRHKRYPWFSVQFHPEACGGPTDTEFLFDKFVDMI